jgi:hypothetical protein
MKKEVIPWKSNIIVTSINEFGIYFMERYLSKFSTLKLRLGRCNPKRK